MWLIVILNEKSKKEALEEKTDRIFPLRNASLKHYTFDLWIFINSPTIIHDSSKKIE